MSEIRYTSKDIQYIDTGYVPTSQDAYCTVEDSEEPKRRLDLTSFLYRHKAEVDECNRLTMQCLCDGTYLFMYEMLYVLGRLGCKNIQTSGELVTEGVPEDKPWCNYLFKASGELPENTVYFKGMIWVKEGEVDGYS